MPPRKKPAEQSAAAIGHNSDLSDDALIAENFKLEDLIKAAKAKFDEWAKPHQARLKEIEDTLFARLAERQSDSTKTEAGTAYISRILNTRIENREPLIDFLMDNWDQWGADMMQVNVTKDAVKRYMEENNGQLPPGISVSHFARLNIRRS